jgi:phosphatidylglycerophosphate synthase
MLDAKLTPWSRALCTRLARPWAAKGLRADHVTVAGFLIGLAALPAIATGHPLLGLILILTNRLADGLDGALASLHGPTHRGAFLDITLDFVFYASVPLAFALADPSRNGLAAAFLLFGFIGTGASFLAFATLAAKQGQSAKEFPNKGIYYLGGLTEGLETILFFIFICILPQAFALGAFIFGTACLLTTGLRLHWGARHLSG